MAAPAASISGPVIMRSASNVGWGALVGIAGSPSSPTLWLQNLHDLFLALTWGSGEVQSTNAERCASGGR